MRSSFLTFLCLVSLSVGPVFVTPNASACGRELLEMAEDAVKRMGYWFNDQFFEFKISRVSPVFEPFTVENRLVGLTQGEIISAFLGVPIESDAKINFFYSATLEMKYSGRENYLSFLPNHALVNEVFDEPNPTLDTFFWESSAQNALEPLVCRPHQIEVLAYEFKEANLEIGGETIEDLLAEARRVVAANLSGDGGGAVQMNMGWMFSGSQEDLMKQTIETLAQVKLKEERGVTPDGARVRHMVEPFSGAISSCGPQPVVSEFEFSCSDYKEN